MAGAAKIRSRTSRDDGLRAAADLLWECLGDSSPSPDRPTVSWIGFYEIATENNSHGAEPGEAMVLGPCRDKPACSPIGLHGACGQGFARGATLIVTDVRHLGDGYVACDPLDASELVIPLFDNDGAAWGVLDADSFAIGAFDGRDADLLEQFCIEAGLTTQDAKPTREII